MHIGRMLLFCTARVTRVYCETVRKSVELHKEEHGEMTLNNMTLPVKSFLLLLLSGGAKNYEQKLAESNGPE